MTMTLSYIHAASGSGTGMPRRLLMCVYFCVCCRLVQDSVQHVIDNLGRASSDAQGLSRVITTADKLRNAPTHILYLLKDPQAKG